MLGTTFEVGTDLAMRLTNEPNEEEERFFEFLSQRLGATVMEPYEDHYLVVEIREIHEEDDDTGFVTLGGEEFRVVLESRLCFGSRIDYLLHELAHVGSWFVNEPNDHGPHFGIEWARLYTLYLELYEEFWIE